MKKTWLSLFLIIATFSAFAADKVTENDLLSGLTAKVELQKAQLTKLEFQLAEINKLYTSLKSTIRENKEISRKNSQWNSIRLNKLNSIREAKQEILQRDESINKIALESSENKKSVSNLNSQIELNTQKSSELGKSVNSNANKQKQQDKTQATLVAANKSQNISLAVSVIILVLLLIIAFLLLRKKMHSGLSSVEKEIQHAKQSLEEEAIKLDSKLLELLEKQLTIKAEEEKVAPQKENDHSLALKVADEITRMQKNIARMDEKTKGLKQLTKGLSRIQSNFSVNGYEILTLLNADYDERMNIDVINFVTDDDLAEDESKITKVIKPQVNFNGVLIQRAQVEVSQN